MMHNNNGAAGSTLGMDAADEYGEQEEQLSDDEAVNDRMQDEEEEYDSRSSAQPNEGRKQIQANVDYFNEWMKSLE